MLSIYPETKYENLPPARPKATAHLRSQAWAQAAAGQLRAVTPKEIVRLNSVPWAQTAAAAGQQLDAVPKVMVR